MGGNPAVEWGIRQDLKLIVIAARRGRGALLREVLGRRTCSLRRARLAPAQNRVVERPLPHKMKVDASNVLMRAFMLKLADSAACDAGSYFDAWRELSMPPVQPVCTTGCTTFALLSSDGAELVDRLKRRALS